MLAMLATSTRGASYPRQRAIDKGDKKPRQKCRFEVETVFANLWKAIHRSTTDAQMVISEQGTKTGKRKNSDLVAFAICDLHQATDTRYVNETRQLRQHNPICEFEMHYCSLVGVGRLQLKPHRDSPWERFWNEMSFHRPAWQVQGPTHAGRQKGAWRS